MEFKNRTILITGGASGIGLSLARALAGSGNTILICGRDARKLDAAVQANPGFVALPCDVSDPASVDGLAKALAEMHPTLSVLVNNAGANQGGDLCTPDGIGNFENMLRTNTVGPLLVTTALLPILRKNTDPTVVFVTSGLAYTPLAVLGGYCASKAAMHSLALSLRKQLPDVRVVEVLPPTTDTGMTKDFEMKKASPDDVAKRAVSAMVAGKLEIPIGESAQLRLFARVAPGFAFDTINTRPGRRP
jgi:uncharacterized oxidoreductase